MWNRWENCKAEASTAVLKSKISCQRVIRTPVAVIHKKWDMTDLFAEGS